MQLFYVANARMPTEKAHGLQIAKMCEAFATCGFEVTLVVPKRRNAIPKSVQDFYKTQQDFRVVYLPVIDIFGFRFIQLTFALSLRKFFRTVIPDSVVFTRDIVAAKLLAKKFPVYYEMHDFPETRLSLWQAVLQRVRGIVVTNQWKKDQLVERFAIPKTSIHVAPNGFDPELFAVSKTKQALRQELTIPDEKFVLCYVGMLRTMGMQKGVDVILSSLQQLPEDVVLMLVGGSEVDIAYYRKKAEELGVLDKVMFVGHVAHDLVPKYLKAADVLLAPFPDQPHYRWYMSPIKLFEYMASGVPIIVSDLPSIRELVDDSMVTFMHPDDLQSFVQAIRLVRETYRDVCARAQKTREHVQQFTWKHRANSLLSFIEH